MGKRSVSLRPADSPDSSSSAKTPTRPPLVFAMAANWSAGAADGWSKKISAMTGILIMISGVLVSWIRWLPPSGGRSALPRGRHGKRQPLAQLAQPLQDDKRGVAGERLILRQDAARRRDREHARADAIEHDERFLDGIDGGAHQPAAGVEVDGAA